MQPKISAEHTGPGQKFYRSWITKHFKSLFNTSSIGFEKKGLGVVIVWEGVHPLEGLLDDVDPGQRIEYLTLEEIDAWPRGNKWEKQNKERLPIYVDAKKHVGTYDPQNEMVVSVFDQSGYDDTYTVSARP